MRTYILYILALLTLAGCSKSNELRDITDTDLYGNWVVSGSNNQTLYTNDWFAMTFSADMSQNHDFRVAFDNGTSKWVLSPSATYKVEDDHITITNPDNALHLKIQADILVSYEIDLMIYTVIEHTVNGVQGDDIGTTYNALRERYTHSHQIIGTWQGSCITIGQNNTPFRWQFLDDGSFKYFIQNGAGEWIEQTDNQGAYYLYGSLLSTTWVNDILTSHSGEQCELWQIDIQNNTMAWVADRADIGRIQYNFTKII